MRGFIATVPGNVLRDPDGAVVADLDTNAFFNRPAPATVNPSLWRNAGLLARHGLFNVADRLYQVRGLSISNMTVIVGDTGYVVVDPGFEDAARAGMELVYHHLGRKPVTGILYTHSHSDHYSGVRGVLSDEEAARRKVPVVAPAGFIREVMGESIIAGPAMGRRAGYQFGFRLPQTETGGVTLGIGPTIRTVAPPAGRAATARSRLPIVPTHEISRTGETLTIDGVRFEFQMATNTEAPAELHFYLPDFKALCLAENANGTLHNALPVRGALVRDVNAWADVLTEAIGRYGDRSEVLFTSHFWPHWGRADILDYLQNHRDAYKYLHDQSVRLMNDGLTGNEIADQLRYPDVLASRWFNREYYGTLSHNSRAVYQRYMGFYDGNPAHLDPLPPEDAAKRYVAAIGGGERGLALAEEAEAKGDHRWAVELLDRLVFADPTNARAKARLADLYEQLGYRAESSTWRNGYLTAAQELRQGSGTPTRGPAFAGLANLPIDLLLDAAAVRLVPDRARGVVLDFNIVDADTGVSRRVQVRNAVLAHEATDRVVTCQPVVRLTAQGFHAALSGQPPAGLKTDEQALLRRFAELFDGPLQNFAIVTP
ncbi:alkyl/aryl-sulfatase [Sphingomonas sp. Leaf67]|uniref:alkyl/aryl-sulfatase n=1 Tax=Sphingomonas sp. Leaf67 TaxID=1736230 RepID=UPI001F3671B4|nr:alkyl sulfatase dimerization domain-containing protein [Sphingomonas sp. Leaf67]